MKNRYECMCIIYTDVLKGPFSYFDIHEKVIFTNLYGAITYSQALVRISHIYIYVVSIFCMT